MGLIKEIRFFRSQDYNMQVLLLTVMIYAFVLPVVEIFAGAYVMRNTNDPALVAFYQLAMYCGIVTTSLVNGLLLKFINVKVIYSGGILSSVWVSSSWVWPVFCWVQLRDSFGQTAICFRSTIQPTATATIILDWSRFSSPWPTSRVRS